MTATWRVYARYGNPNHPGVRAASAAQYLGVFPMATVDVHRHDVRALGFQCQICARGIFLSDCTRATPEEAVQAAWEELRQRWGDIGGEVGQALAALPRVLTPDLAQTISQKLPASYDRGGSPPWD